ncbi:MAG: LysM peptidoglycan-binding domain-containing protein [Gemmatimonadetes bacterium]|nr:LysM peptidoglycan-binding domain-containing protein [Gemmatimonadota bacterium]
MVNAMPRCHAIPLAVLLACAASLLPQTAHGQSLRGSTTSVNRMYYHAVDHGMYFYKTPSGLKKAATEGRFVRLSTGTNYRVAGVSYPYVQEATRLFVERLGQQYRQACGERMVVTSGARPQSMRLANSVDKSVHPTGMAIDLRKPGGTRCRTWLRNTLLSLEGEGVVEATEEYSPPHFHVAVFPTPYTRYVSRLDGAPAYAANTPSNRYRVRSGDSLWGIARQHSTNVESLRSANQLRSSSLKIGQVLVIPR